MKTSPAALPTLYLVWLILLTAFPPAARTDASVGTASANMPVVYAGIAAEPVTVRATAP